MLNLDARTLLIAEIPVLLLVGGLILTATLLGRRDRALWWVGGALLLIGVGFLASVIDPIGTWARSVTSFGALLILAHACIWTGLRAFSGKPARWLWILVGTLLWGLACLWPGFVSSPVWRGAAYSVLTLAYVGLAVREIWPEWRSKTSLAVLPFCILAVHGMLTAVRMVTVFLTAPGPGLLRADFPLAVFEGMLFFIGMAFAVLMMVGARSERRYRHAALHDALTDLANRRALYEQGGEQLQNALSRGLGVALLMCDLDHFKRINDGCGHETGDRVLAAFAGVLRQAVRKEDLCARIGGEEFVVLAPDIDVPGALALAERIRDGLQHCRCDLCAPLSVSIGIACAPLDGRELGQLLACADQALYRAKNAGRDCARLWTEEPEDGDSAAVAGGGEGRARQHPVNA